MDETERDLAEGSYVLCPTCLGTFYNCLRCSGLGLISASDLSLEETRYVKKYSDSMLYWNGGGEIHIDVEPQSSDNTR